MISAPITRRRFLAAGPALAMSAARVSAAATATPVAVLHTFGDSILDCGRYNEHGVTPGQLMIRNDDALFPEFRGQILRPPEGAAIRLDHRARDGATVEGLARQLAGLEPDRQPAVALLTIGGNDLLRGLAADTGPGMRRFERALEMALRQLPVRPVVVGNVYDPTFGDDARNFLGVSPRIARANLRRINAILAAAASRHGALADLHAHFLAGDPSWFTAVIEPSLRGASEVRRVFLSVL